MNYHSDEVRVAVGAACVNEFEARRAGEDVFRSVSITWGAPGPSSTTADTPPIADRLGTGAAIDDCIVSEADAVIQPREAEDVAAVKQVLASDEWDFRRTESVIAETGLDAGQVRRLLGRRDIARQPWGRTDVDMYAPADRKVSAREVLALVRVFVTNKP